MSSTVTLDVCCPECGGDISIQLTEWRSSQPLARAAWNCPYCDRIQMAGFPGRIAWVTKRFRDTVA